jgi:hypothetical protein
MGQRPLHRRLDHQALALSYLEVEPINAYEFIANAMSRGEFRFDKIRDWISSQMKSL